MVRSVLVTRPSGQAEVLGQALEAAGLTVSYAPMLAIEPYATLSADQEATLLSLDQAQHIIFVSQNAIRCGMPWIQRAWTQPPSQARWYAVGKASALALARYGIDAEIPLNDMTSEGLLALPALSQVADQRVVIIKGEGGRTRLRRTLQARNARVDELETYRRRRPQYAPGELSDLMQQHAVDCILISSGEGLDNMVLLLGVAGLKQAQALTLVVPGERVAEAARLAGFSRIVVADNATDDAMLAALTR